MTNEIRSASRCQQSGSHVPCNQWCRECPRGFSRSDDGDPTMCRVCPPGKTTDRTGATFCEDCRVGMMGVLRKMDFALTVNQESTRTPRE